MKTKILLLLVPALVAGFLASAQEEIYKNIQMHRAGDALLSSEIKIPCMGTVNTPTADLKWIPGLSHKFMESDPEETNKEELEKIRAEAYRKKMSQQSTTDEERGVNPSSQAVTPNLGVNYIANKSNGWSPLDNHVAISNKGMIVTVANDTFEVDDSLGNNLYYNTLNTFINDNTIPNACDPNILYDPAADRFIFYCQEVTSSGGPNHMMVFFSKTNNPATGGWNYFKLSGNPLNDGSDADYPKLAVTDKDLFISSNLFGSSGSFNQAIVWQIQKSTGYSGGTLNSKLWSGLTGSPFTVLPVSEGQGKAYGPGCWMLATNSSSGTAIDLYQITNDVTSSPTMNHYSVTTTSYSAAGNTAQKGTSTQLKITDARALSGFYLNGLIHFTFNSQDASGNTAINYNRLDVNAKTNTSKLFSASGIDFGYPAVASYTAAGVLNDNSVMIGYAACSSTMYPEMRVVSCDNGMNFGTAITVKTGAGYVSGSSGTSRWGDYSGMCRRHNSPQACCWMSGSYGNSSNTWEAYVAQIHDAGFALGVPSDTKPQLSMKTYPNPVRDIFSVDFSAIQDGKIDVTLYNMEGQVVKALYNGYCHQGENTFWFNQSNLSAGTYELIIRTSDNQLLHQKLVVL
jgi:hypothetical protein